MVNKPKAIGTAAETAVVRYLQTHGWPHAERRSLRGQLDAGDITGTPGICWEVKGGQAAKSASDKQIELWLSEVSRARVHADANVSLLVVQRSGAGPANAGRWWTILPSFAYERLVTANVHAHMDGRPIIGMQGGFHPLRLMLADACSVLRKAGYGSEVDA